MPFLNVPPESVTFSTEFEFITSFEMVPPLISAVPFSIDNVLESLPKVVPSSIMMFPFSFTVKFAFIVPLFKVKVLPNRITSAEQFKV